MAIFVMRQDNERFMPYSPFDLRDTEYRIPHA